MISTIIIVITIAISVYALFNRSVFDILKFNAFLIKHSNQWYRSLSYGLIHADWIHLGINMYVLYSFGSIVEYFFDYHFAEKSVFYFILLYVSSVAFSVLPDIRRHRDNPGYNAVGASGAVSAIVFSSILFYPLGELYILFIPFPIPSFIFGVIYLVYSAYMSKKQSDNIGHLTHFSGAIYGFLFPIALKPQLFINFISQIQSFFS